ncbi:MAG TPA: methyltransferase, partial [Desulfurivibrionaceae bacterium]|nr:methyltransferase [Desulfurivibrionaceae bacterium]
VLLAHFAAPRPGEKVLELCAGNGVVSLIMAFRQPAAVIAALELQPQLVGLMRSNVALNRYEERITVVEGDCRSLADHVTAGGFDRVVMNPPYRKVESGRQTEGDEAAQARHELTLTLEEAVAAMAMAVKNRGRCVVVYPAGRLAALMAALKGHRLEPKRLQIVHSYPGDTGRLVLVEAVKNGGEELAVLPPFFVYQAAGGAYTPEMAALYAAGCGQKHIDNK